MNRRTLFATLATLAMILPVAAVAAEKAPSAARTQMIFVRKGSGETAGYRTVSDTSATDRIVFVFLGSGHASLTLTDADEPGDTLTVTGEFTSAQPIEFQESATSPNQILKTLPVNITGMLTLDVGYSSIVNGVPARYFYKVQF